MHSPTLRILIITPPRCSVKQKDPLDILCVKQFFGWSYLLCFNYRIEKNDFKFTQETRFISELHFNLTQ